MPSPNKIECKLGNFSSLTKFNTATESVAHNTAENNKMSYKFTFIGNNSNRLSKLAPVEMRKKDIRVPKIP